MKPKNIEFLIIKNVGRKILISFRNLNKLTILHSEALRFELLEVVSKRNYELEIDLLGIKFIDSSIFDILNLISRMAHRYNSRVILSNVSTELSELIELVKMHSVFDIKQVVMNTTDRSVA